MTNEQPASTNPFDRLVFNPFWPIVFMAVSLGLVLLWNLVASIRGYAAALRMEDQQTLASAQAFDAEEKLKVLMMELLVLAKQDPDAKTIADKYQIRYNAPVTPAAPVATPPTPAPAAKPAPAAPEPEKAPAAKEAAKPPQG
jgi:hypothetical protein